MGTDGFSIRAAKRPELKTGAFSEPIKGVQVSTDGADGALRDADGVNASGKKKKKREMPDFYRFQLREKKREELNDHRKRKAQDAEQVYYMKKKLKFKTDSK